MFKKIGLVGCGQMGAGIAQVAAGAGYQVTAVETSEELFESGLRRINLFLIRAVEKGKIDETAKEKTLANITGCTDYEDLAPCDLIIEAITEDFITKKELFSELDRICPPETIFASNTSSIPIGDLAAVTTRRDRFIGLHFFNPVPVMKLVELVRTIDTSEEVLKTAREFSESLGKTVVSAKDTPGFIVNVLLVPYLLDAVRQYENGLASREDIDSGMKLGCGHPMGPLELTDFIGLDTILSIADIMFTEFKDSHYAAPPLLRRMVKAGYLGRKSGRGFYEYKK
jgi:3-hydroxybutyryl-CoA dehydrogenase